MIQTLLRISQPLASSITKSTRQMHTFPSTTDSKGLVSAGSHGSTEPEAPNLPNVATATRKPFPLWILGIAGALILAAACIYIPEIYAVKTDDAYVQADTISIVPKIGAYVIAVHVQDNTRFEAGQLLVELDPRDFQVAVDSAQADLRSAQAAKANAQTQLDEQTHIIAAAKAAVTGDRATLEFAGQQLARYGILAKNGAGSDERWQQAQSEIGEKKAAMEHDVAALATAQSHIGVLQSQIQQADAMIARQRAAVAQARLNLSYTKIYSGSAGTVANKSIQVGNFVQPGQTLFSAVPNRVYVIANFKETQLTHVHPGQPVTIDVDAFPNLHLHGHVDSLQRGTGSNFALLPPENATGNFVKIVQRVPVKIIIDGSADALQSISPGMSVEPIITVGTPPNFIKPLL